MTSESAPDYVSGENDFDFLAQGEALGEDQAKKNFAKVGSSRPSTLLYTFGPGAVMDLPHFTVLPLSYDAWEPIWRRRDGVGSIQAPKLLANVRSALGAQVEQLRPFPHQVSTGFATDEGRDLGIPAIVFPQWLRCTGCDLLAPVTHFGYSNTRPRRPDHAVFEHVGCPGRPRRAGQARAAQASASTTKKQRRAPATPARYLLACTRGHLDEFPYGLWVHEGRPCPKAEAPQLRMVEGTAGRGASSTIVCTSCDAARPMSQAQGEAGQQRLPLCRGRHPHLDTFDPHGCGLPVNLILVGASNLWFPAIRSAIVMPQVGIERDDTLVDRLRAEIGDDLVDVRTNPRLLRRLARDADINVTAKTDDALLGLVERALTPVEPGAAVEPAPWEPADLLVPEWNYLRVDPAGPHHEDLDSGLTVTLQPRGELLPAGISRVLAVDRLRRVNALLGFTRLDESDRILDPYSRLVPLSRRPPTWVVATEDRGEGMLLTLDEAAVDAWEERIRETELWDAHRQAHWHNFENRMSTTADNDTRAAVSKRFPPPRYWLVHTLSHLLIRQMAMTSGYGAASLAERLYAWPALGERPAAAALLILTASSDSDGTLGGLVRLSQPELLQRSVLDALRAATRCSSDPICAGRVPGESEDFLHGAACHCCCMASETSCERSNRFLDRRFVVPLPGFEDYAFFQGLS